MSDAIHYDVLIGRPERRTPLMGVLGQALEDRERVIAMDLTFMNCITLFGEPGAGKSYCMGTIIEMAATACPGINTLAGVTGAATIIFHYSASQAYRPEFASAIRPNDIRDQVELLRTRYGAAPAAIQDCLLLAPADVVPARRAEFPGIPVQPLTFTARELQATHWRILMGALGEADTMYLQVINQILKQGRAGTTVPMLAQAVAASALAPPDQDRARVRLALAAQYIDDQGPPISSCLRPGRVVIVDLRDEFLQKKEALSLLLVLLQLFADVTDRGKPLQKFCVFDEAHKYLRDPDLVECLTETIREMRHKSTSILIASQDPPSVPLPMIELSSMTVMLKMSSPLWLRHVAAVKPAYDALTPAQMAALQPGEAYVWAKSASDPRYTQLPHKMRIRPRCTKHGGDTKVTVDLQNTVADGAPPGSSCVVASISDPRGASMPAVGAGLVAGSPA